MTAPYSQIIVACILMFAVYWMWSARRIRPAKRSESVVSTLISNLLMWPGFVLLALGSLRRQPAWSFGLPASMARSIVGTTLVAIGIGIAIW